MTAAANAREAILNSVRSALRRGPLDDKRRAELDARRPQHTRPAQDEELVARFIRKFESRAGTTARVASRADVPAAVEAYRVDKGLPAHAAVGAALKDLAWPAGLAVHHDPAGISETMAVSQALAGIAEPGSLMMASGPASPITHNFVPDDHVVVLDAGAIVGHFEEAWEVLRARAEGMPRATNIISGPSRTADVEQTIQLGAHGPRRVHVIIVG
ncbi:LUD domain-containing protein [Aromatoleum toluolicum]|uniref:Lactate utilization protein C n=1 Tax=Aromatoleum toluolicum TaxID=90060 RepID=A0ABX1NN48_9RHOO|nr:LUD domain-containing protein [Aromatoleum toluolicum]NMG00565.1 LUD domain-containing protein [Aromatoleum toluolicum]